MRLTVEAVDELAERCKWLLSDPGPDVRAIFGVEVNLYLHAGRVEAATAAIGALLAELPDAFRDGRAAGCSFLDACRDRHGRRWTGLHRDMDRLFCLGIAAGLARWTVPQTIWPLLRGGKPYVTVL